MSKQTFTTGQILTAAQMTTLQANDYNQTVSAKVASYTLVATDAGTRITMSNAAATTITVNTSLFTAGDTLTITNIGAGVCTITAGTATVSTAGSLALAQYDSGTLYFSSTSAAIWNGANPGDITGVTAGTGISGGGTSGTVTVTNSMATAITTAGDTLYGTGSGTFSRLGIGTAGQVLQVNSGATAPEWATAAAGGTAYAAGKNPFLNSNFSVWQRGTSFAGNTYSTYSADRWVASRGTTAGSTFSRQASGYTGIQYSMRVARDLANTSTAIIYLSQSFESVNSYRYAGQTVTLSFYAKAGANYSAASAALGVTLASGTGTDENILNSYTGAAYPVSSSATLTTSWQRFTFTGTVSSSATELAFYTSFTPVGVAGAADNYEITGVQLEIASAASAYSPNCPTYATELSACQRYFEIYSSAGSDVFGIGYTQNATTNRMMLPVMSKRTLPTIASTGTLQVILGGGSSYTITSFANINNGGTPNMINFNAIIAAGGVAGGACGLYTSGACTLSFSAELQK